MNVILKDSYKADVFTFEIESQNSIVNLTITNAISWDWMKMRLTKDELKDLANFINQFIKD